MDNMIKFYRGLVANLPATGVNGALYITTDEGAIYYGTGDGMKRLGDFIQVANVAALPEKAHESCLYYCVAENILAKWNGSEWKQINKQPTAEELKTLLGLGALAYKTEVAEGDLNSDLAAKINAASGAQHAHDNKTVLDGITAEKVAAWDAAEGNAKGYADGLNTAMNTRVEALEAVDHTHGNKELLDTYTQTEANLADAVAKKHAHTFNETELNKIVEGDVAKWNAAEGNAKAYVDEKIADLDYTDTAVDGEYVSAVNEVDGKISVTRKALPDYTNVYEVKGEAAKVQGELNTYKEANDIALANVKATAEAAYVKPATGIAKDDLSAEVKVSLGKADTALQSHQDISHLAVKTEVETELGKKVDKTVYEGKVGELETAIGKKVDKVEGYSLVADTEIARLANVTNYDDTQVKADIAKKADAELMATELGKKVDKVEGKSLVLDTEIVKLAGVSEGANKVEASETNGKIKIDGVETVVYTHPEKHTIAEVDGLQAALDGKQAAGDYSEVGHKHVKEDITDFAHTHTKSEITDFAHTHVASEITDLDATIKGYDYATKTELGNVDAKFAGYVTTEAYGADKKVIDDAIADRYTKGEADAKFAIKGADAYDDTELKNRVKAIEDDYLVEADKTELAGLITAEKQRAEGIEGGLETRLAAVEGDYLKGADKTELEGKITAEETRAKGVEESLQTQINTIMNNPDAEGAINSINEFTKYVEDHGEIAEGFRTDINKNKEDIAANAKAIADQATADEAKYETKTDASAKLTEAKGYTDTEVAKDRARLDVLEAIDHEAYIAADSALKTELEGKIADGDAATLEAAKADAANKSAVVLAEAQTYADGKVTALAEGQVATNKNDIADLLAQMTWGEF